MLLVEMSQQLQDVTLNCNTCATIRLWKFLPLQMWNKIAVKLYNCVYVATQQQQPAKTARTCFRLHHASVFPSAYQLKNTVSHLTLNAKNAADTA